MEVGDVLSVMALHRKRQMAILLFQFYSYTVIRVVLARIKVLQIYQCKTDLAGDNVKP